MEYRGTEGVPVSPGVRRAVRQQGFSIDLASRQLFHEGSALPIEPKVFDLIALLVRERHRAVSREELNARVWNGDRVCSAALTQCIWCARQLFHDSAREPRYISTHHRWGYRFIGSVEERCHASGGPVFLLRPAASERFSAV